MLQNKFVILGQMELSKKQLVDEIKKNNSKDLLAVLNNWQLNIKSLEELRYQNITEDLLIFLWFYVFQVPYTHPYVYETSVANLKKWNATLLENFGYLMENIRYVRDFPNDSSSPEVVALITKIKQEGAVVFKDPPVYVKQSEHFGTSVNKGLYSLIAFQKGTLIGQFTGSVHRLRFRRSNYQQGSDMRKSYALPTEYKGIEYIVNPLNAEETEPLIENFGAFMNEPSMIPRGHKVKVFIESMWKHGTVQKYDSMNCLYTILIEGEEHDVLANEIVYDEEEKHIANCIWKPFPIPIEFYAQYKDDECVWSFKGNSSETIKYDYDLLEAMFHQFMYEDGTIYSVRPNMFEHIKIGTVLLLKDNILSGLVRYATVVKVSKVVSVVHTVNETYFWKLPQTIRTGKLNIGRKIVHIPFPLIYAYDDIPAETELLVLYNEKASQNEQRGSPCCCFTDRVIDDSLLGPKWNVLPDNDTDYEEDDKAVFHDLLQIVSENETEALLSNINTTSSVFGKKEDAASYPFSRFPVEISRDNEHVSFMQRQAKMQKILGDIRSHL